MKHDARRSIVLVYQVAIGGARSRAVRVLGTQKKPSVSGGQLSRVRETLVLPEPRDALASSQAAVGDCHARANWDAGVEMFDMGVVHPDAAA